jgi:hypothetical protein
MIEQGCKAQSCLSEPRIYHLDLILVVGLFNLPAVLKPW